MPVHKTTLLRVHVLPRRGFLSDRDNANRFVAATCSDRDNAGVKKNLRQMRIDFLTRTRKKQIQSSSSLDLLPTELRFIFALGTFS